MKPKTTHQKISVMLFVNTLEYYAIALHNGKIAQLLVTRENGKQISQEWTGKTYPSERQGLKDCERLNCR